MQRNDSKGKCKNHGHDNEEHIEAAVLPRWIEPHKQDTRECISCHVADNWYYKQGHVPETSTTSLLGINPGICQKIIIKTTIQNAPFLLIFCNPGVIPCISEIQQHNYLNQQK